LKSEKVHEFIRIVAKVKRGLNLWNEAISVGCLCWQNCDSAAEMQPGLPG